VGRIGQHQLIRVLSYIISKALALKVEAFRLGTAVCMGFVLDQILKRLAQVAIIVSTDDLMKQRYQNDVDVVAELQ